jgi:membrane-associated phospholipid phosphatase
MHFLLKPDTTLFIGNFWLWIKAIDQWLFLYVNRFWANSFLDAIFPIWRESLTWIPVYLFLFIFCVINFNWKALLWSGLFIITVSLCDQVSSAFLKDFVGRIRPCSDPYFSQYVRLLINRCPGSGSFTSSHATNHFGMAVYICVTFKEFIGKWKYLVYFWAATVAYGQVYVGVHYPFDVIGGALLGSLIGWMAASFHNRRVGVLSLKSTEGKAEAAL